MSSAFQSRSKETAFIRCMIILFVLSIFGCQSKKNQQEYTCSMHPEVIKTEPGHCPICGMELILKSKPADETKVSADLNYLLKPTNELVISSIRTIAPTAKSTITKIQASGTITYDTRNVTSISARYSGRIEKLYLRYNFQPVKKGQKILEIYSAELVAAQRELLYVLQSDKDNSTLVEGAKEKLRLLGLYETQITELIKSGRESTSFALYSPVDGYLMALDVAENNSTTNSVSQKAMSGGMEESPRKTNKQESGKRNSELQVREGMYVTAGQIIFSVVNTSIIWAEFDVVQSQNSLIHAGDEIILLSGGVSDSLRAKVNFIQPFFKDNEPFVKVRVVLPNANHRFSIGQFVEGVFSKSSPPALWLPKESVLDLGLKKIVFIKRKNVFRPKEIITGQKSGAWIELVKGLTASDSISYNAQTMMDSENFIQVKN